MQKDTIIQQQHDEIKKLKDEIRELKEMVMHLSAEVEKLTKRLNKDSNNSSQPPSSDGLKKRRTQSLREKGIHPGGGQKGHTGKTLQQVSNPDHIERHLLDSCPQCSSSLIDVEVDQLKKRQVFDIAMPKLEVMEHQVEVKRCPCCKEKVESSFPENILTPVQYGSNIQSFAQYLLHGQLIPEDRLQEVFLDIFGLQIATATLTGFSKKLSNKLEPFEQIVLDQIRKSIKKHLDETGFRINGQTQWLHVASNEHLTYYHFSKKRKSLLEGLLGTVVHDHWKPYYQLPKVKHALCNAHHLRELRSLIEDKERWATKMWRCLLFAHTCRKMYPERSIPKETLNTLIEFYDSIVNEGLCWHNALSPLPTSRTRGRKKKRPGHNLLLRLQNYKEDVLRFLSDHHIPFTNNQAERDLRMMKCKQKISGGFRTDEGALHFVRIRGFISTARKQGWNIFQSLSRAIAGDVPMPA